jgi:twitching motility protein PilT
VANTLKSIDELLGVLVEHEASDLHLAAGSPPVIRVNGRLQRVPELEKLTPEDTRTIVYRILSTEQQKTLETRRQIDFSYSIPGVARFRVNAYFQRTSVGAAFRLIPTEIKTLEQLALPAKLYELADMARGLILVTGPTGSGKSATLASLLDHINRNRHEHIPRSRTRSSSSTGTAAASSTSARSAPTRRPSPKGSALRSARTPT